MNQGSSRVGQGTLNDPTDTPTDDPEEGDDGELSRLSPFARSHLDAARQALAREGRR